MAISETLAPQRLRQLEETHMRRFNTLRRIGDAWMQHLQDQPLRANDLADCAAFTTIANKALAAYRLALSHYSLAAQCREALA